MLGLNTYATYNEKVYFCLIQMMGSHWIDLHSQSDCTILMRTSHQTRSVELPLQQMQGNAVCISGFHDVLTYSCNDRFWTHYLLIFEILICWVAVEDEKYRNGIVQLVSKASTQLSTQKKMYMSKS